MFLLDFSCPGSNMFLFRFPNGKLILHTGDFRAAPQLLTHPLLQPNQIDTIYLDTTYAFLFARFFSSLFLFNLVIVIVIIVFHHKMKSSKVLLN